MHRPPARLEPDELRAALLALETMGYSATSRLPLFAARHWSPARERQAYLRYRDGSCNIEEVAVPRWYWRRLPSSLAPLFEQLTLGRRAGSPSLTALRPLWDGELPRWRLVRRFDRYVLHSRPEVTDDSLVYFGDDTLFLMAGARRLLACLEGRDRVRVLDLCCGGGGVGLGLPLFEGELVGVDIHEPAIALAHLAAQAQELTNYSYRCAEAEAVLDESYDLVVGNPPTLSPELGGRPTLYATAPASRFLDLIDRLRHTLTPPGRALFTVFSQARGQGAEAEDPLRRELATLLTPWRGYLYSVRRQFSLGGGAWLRHVALEILPQAAERGERFEAPAKGGLQLPALEWRRDRRFRG